MKTSKQRLAIGAVFTTDTGTIPLSRELSAEASFLLHRFFPRGEHRFLFDGFGTVSLRKHRAYAIQVVRLSAAEVPRFADVDVVGCSADNAVDDVFLFAHKGNYTQYAVGA